MAFLITALQLWMLFFATAKIASTLSKGALASLLTRHNIKLQFCFISFYTTRFNNRLEALGRRRKSLLSYWFFCGVLCAFPGLLLSLFLFSTNITLAVQDFFHPLLPIVTSDSPHLYHRRHPHHHRIPPRLHHAALSLNYPRAPSPRVPFLHNAPRPWFLPPAYWHRIAPRDHAAAHMLMISARAEAALSDWTSRRYFPGGLYDVPPPMGRRRRMMPKHPGYPRFKDPFRPPCNRNKERNKWNRGRLPSQGLPGRKAEREIGQEVSLTLGDGGGNDKEGDDNDNEERQKSNVSIRWSRKLQSIEERGGGRGGDGGGRMRIGRPETRENGEEDAYTEGPGRSSFLIPLVPGVTVPVGDVWYMILAILIAAVVHELGHALAAAMQNGKVSGVGGFLALALPGAYVQLGGIDEIGVLGQLKVYCAGAWHNLVSALLALVLVGWLPLLMGWGYTIGVGALVVGVPEESPLKGYVDVGDVILRMGKFEVKDGGGSFRYAVSGLILTNDTVGFCVPQDLYRNFSKPRSGCCQKEYMQRMEAGDKLGEKCFRVEGIEKRTSCINPSVVSTQPTCRVSMECSGKGFVDGKVLMARNDSGDEQLEVVSRMGEPSLEGGAGGVEGMETEVEDGGRTGCFIPVLPEQQQLIDVRVQSLKSGEIMHFFYEGYPQVLGRSVSVSSYVPRIWRWAPKSIVQQLAYLDIPNMVERLLQYLSSISLALAILNMAPVIYLDGDPASGLFLRLLMPGLSKEKAMKFRSVVVCIGSVLLLLNLLIALLEIDTGISASE